MQFKNMTKHYTKKYMEETTKKHSHGHQYYLSQNSSKKKIILEDANFSIIFSAYNYLYALHIYNAFLNQKYQKFSLNQNSMTLKSISMIPEKQITTNKIQIKMSSPIICRNHNRETLKDMYYSFERPEFEKYIRINILEQMKKEALDSSLLEGFKINPIQSKKIIVKLYEKKIESSIGTFELEGKTKLLDYLYRAGIGAKKQWDLDYLKLYEERRKKQFMEEITIRLNDFLFNSGILGFIKVLENAEKEDLIETKANTINVNPKAIENFASDYISAMLNTYEEDTKWYTIVSMKEWIRNLDIEDKEQIKKLEEQYKFIKKSMESASYKAGYEILKRNKLK